MKLTIFTPTYNREHTLPRLYESLKAQFNRSFEWLIVDDGSSDGTAELIKKWKAEKQVEIKYIYQQNAGKMQAHNAGVLNAKTELFVCVDSDDFITVDAVDKILQVANDIMDKEEIVGIIAGKGDKSGNIIGTEFPKNVAFSTLNNLYRNGFKGDTTLVFKTKVLQQYLFPKFEQEKFITEDYVYCQIDEKYSYKILPEVLTICEYLNGGYSNSALKLLLNNPIGANAYYNLKIKLAKSFKEKCMFVIRYTGIGKLTKNKLLFKKCNAKLLYFLLFPLSFLYYCKKKKLTKGV